MLYIYLSLMTWQMMIQNEDIENDMVTEYPQVCSVVNNIEPSNITNKKRHLIWKRVKNNAQNEAPTFKSAHPNNDEFTGDIPSPINFFKAFITDEMLEIIVEQSNLYAVQKDSSKPLGLKKPS